MEVGIHEAKTKLSKLIPAVLSGEEVIITKAGEPLVKLVPVTAKRGPRPLGFYEGKIKFHGDLLEPIPEEIIDTFWSPDNKDEISS
jgi:prevent-host-death family protein